MSGSIRFFRFGSLHVFVCGGGIILETENCRLVLMSPVAIPGKLFSSYQYYSVIDHPYTLRN
jgi:hypothetical protein